MTEVDGEDYVVEHPFDAQENNEVTLRVGDVRKVDQKEGGWWRGSVRNGQGYFPSSHVKKLRLSDIIFQADNKCLVVFDYKPSQEDELHLRVGDKVQVLGEVELGWWRGRIGDKVGIFPASHIRVSSNSSYLDETYPDKSIENVAGEILKSPVQLRRNSSSHHSKRLSMNTDTSLKDQTPVSYNLIDPEDETLTPLYDTSIPNIDPISCSASLSESKSRGILSRLRHSIGAKPILPKFLRRRLSFGSFMETQSTCSPTVNRRNSFVDSFRRGSSCSVRVCDDDERKIGIFSRLSRNWDNAIPGTGLAVPSPAVDILQKDLRNVHMSGGRRTEHSDSWVWERQELNMVRKKREDFTSGDSGYVDNNIEAEPFGPVAEFTDEVFKDMFPSNNTDSEVDGGQDKIETVETAITIPAISKERTRILTSVGKLSSGGSVGMKNPFLPLIKSDITDTKEIIEI